MMRARYLDPGGHAASCFDTRAHIPDQAMLRVAILGHRIGSASKGETGERGQWPRAVDLGCHAILEPASLRRIGGAVGRRAGPTDTELEFLLQRRRD